MRNIGVIRKADKLGRIVIPMEYRKYLEIGDIENLEILLTNEGILIQKIKDRCILCDSSANLINYKEKLICLTCYKEIKIT